MKKLMMAAVIVCAAVAANAATYNWEANGVFYWGDESATGEEFAGSNIYLFDGNVYSKATIMETLGKGNTSVLDDALNHGSVNSLAEFSFGGSGLTDDGEDPAYINTFLVALTKDEKYATAYEYPALKVTDGIITDGATIAPDWAVATLPGGADWTKVESVPEPTSGLLLLLGVAGLALRRRRA